MKWIAALALVLGSLSVAAYAAPVKLSKDQMDKITAGASQPQSGQPGLTEGRKNGPPPSAH
jgi:hypothetical protein